MILLHPVSLLHFRSLLLSSDLRCATMATLISPSLALVVAGMLLLGFVLYRASIPTPIPGIPYFAASASRPFGDVPDAMRHLGETKQICTFLTQRCVELQSPICQVFMRPFSKPWVVVADSRE